MPGSFAALYYHIVFSTKNRVPFLTPDWRDRLYDYMGGIIRGDGGESLLIGGAADHTHILSSLNKNQGVAKSIGIIKAEATRWVHETFPNRSDFSWQAGYGAFSVSVTGLDRVKKYIAQQEAHHHKETFKEEFRRFLDIHGIPYDERYLWD